MSFILALDQGTTSSRAIVFDHGGAICAAAQQEFRQIFPQPGWVEHDAEEIWRTQLGVAIQALERAGITARELAAVGITNQRETTVVHGFARIYGDACGRDYLLALQDTLLLPELPSEARASLRRVG